MFEFFNKTEKLPRAIRKLIQPRKAFAEKTKTAFLVVFDAAHTAGQATSQGAARPRGSHFTIFAKAIIACAALFAIFAGVSVYADTANVPADSALYPLKRLSENVEFSLAPASAKPGLQATFAARRANEISDLSVRKPSSTIIASLDSDLDSDVDNSVSAAVATNLNDGNLNAFCGKILSAIASSSIALHGQLSVHANVLARFENECALKNGAGAGNATSTQMTAMPTSPTKFRGDRHPGFSIASTTTTTIDPTSSTAVHFRGGGSLDIPFSSSSSRSRADLLGGFHIGAGSGADR